MTEQNQLGRRGFIRTSLTATAGVSALSQARAKSMTIGGPDAGTNEKGMPCGMIGDVKVSRMILGSNVMGGEAHSRDLVYVRELMERYNTEERVNTVMKTAESLGINTVVVWRPAIIKKYNEECGGNLQWISAFPVKKDDDDDAIQRILDVHVQDGTRLLYIWGCSGDLLARDGYMNQVDKALDLAKKAGLICGVGGHSLKAVIECEKQGIRPAFYVKTFHHDRYWSATPKEHRQDNCWYPNGGDEYSYTGGKLDHNDYHDNMWCIDPEDTIEVMKKVTVPWVGFKVLAAGAISPTSGFKYALQNGADFIAVGMLDYQVEEDVNIFKGLFARGIDRERPWMG